MASTLKEFGKSFDNYVFGEVQESKIHSEDNAESSSKNEPKVWLTGPDLIDRIVRAVELGQSVLLSGPRGCGKSYCCRQVIQEAERRGIVTLGASKTFQGNREVPRSDVFDDDIEFQAVSYTHLTLPTTPYV